MDVNNTRFHLLMGQADWMQLIQDSDPASSNLHWDEDAACLSLLPLLYRFETYSGDRLLRPEDRRGAARDQFGNWYWIDESGTEIRFLSRESQTAKHFWSMDDSATSCRTQDMEGNFEPYAPAPSEPLKLRGLTITEHHYLVVGVLDPPGLLIFDLHAGGPPLQIVWPAQIPFAPYDMAPAPGGGVWILDLSEEPRYWALDRRFRVMFTQQDEVNVEPSRESDFQPVDGIPRTYSGRSFPAGVDLSLSSPVATHSPVAIEALPDGSVLILESDPDLPYSFIYRYRFGSLCGRVSLEEVLEGCLDLSADDQDGVKGHDFAFIPDITESDSVKGTLYIADIGGNQAFAFDLKASETDLRCELQKKYFPMRRFGGRGLVSSDGTAYYDYKERWLPLIQHRRSRYEDYGRGTIRFDGLEPGCVWHRILLDACIPPGARVQIESRAGDDDELLKLMPWQGEPDPYLRGDGSELPYYQPYPAESREIDRAGTWELLMQNARGRYLQLRLTLRGTGRNTPRIRALRVYYPRFSYLNEYLPALYRDDEISASFLDRFLANTEGIFTALEDRIAQFQYLLDVRTTPAEYLDWLAGWFGVALDTSWEDQRRRLFIAHAVELFSQRGTVAGLIRAIRLATDPCPDKSLFQEDVTGYYGGFADKRKCSLLNDSVRIVESFLTRWAPGVVFGDPTDAERPGVTGDTDDWTPERGSRALHQRYREYLEQQYGSIDALNEAWEENYSDFARISMSPVLPANSVAAEDWQRFLRDCLGFTYAVVNQSDKGAYQSFLARRYRRIEQLKRAYQITDADLTSFGQIELPEEDDMPSGGKRLFDWIQFVSVALPISRKAHHFTVLIPIRSESDLATQEQRLEIVRKIVEMEKPAHTQFSVRSYWDFFRVGEARLGLDTSIGQGSRFSTAIIGHRYLASSYLYPPHPMNVKERMISDRDHLGDMPPL